MSNYIAYATITGVTNDRYQYRGKEWDRFTHVRHLSKNRIKENSIYKVVAEDGTVIATGTCSGDNFFRKMQNGKENFHHGPSRNAGIRELLLEDQTATVYIAA